MPDALARLTPNEWLIVFAMLVVVGGVMVQAFSGRGPGGQAQDGTSLAILGGFGLLIAVGALHFLGIITIPMPF